MAVAQVYNITINDSGTTGTGTQTGGTRNLYEKDRTRTSIAIPKTWSFISIVKPIILFSNIRSKPNEKQTN